MQLPEGTVTLLFTDVEGSTKLLDALGERYGPVLAEHRRLLREAFTAYGGVEVDTQGDAFFVAFSRPQDALAAAAQAQRALAAGQWPEGASVRVRMGIHTGTPTPGDEGYVGMDVHRAARVMAAGHGGQVVVSQATRELVEGAVPDGLHLRDLGEHRLRDLTLPQRLFELCGEGIGRDFPPLKTLENRPTNLPAQPTPLIGRERELAELQHALEASPLLTLTGPGGTGKTRLALQLAAEVVDRFPGGVFFVALASIRDAALVVPTIAQTLGVKERSGERLDETLAEFVREKQLLLVLDNLEQVVEAASSIASLLARASQLRVVVTSREPLRLSGEREYAVEPLPASEAATLFLERARAARADLAVDEAVVAEICHRLDGLPLAIELAAARVKLLPLPALLERLDARLKLLTGGARDLDERQQTLRAAIDWSYRLLSEDDQLLFRRVGVFAGGWSLEAAEAVCAPEGELDVLDGLGSLVDKSLVRQHELDGEPRFSMLETIREFAAERLGTSNESEMVSERHAEFFTGLAEEAKRHQLGPTLRTWLSRLDDEQDNLRSALEWALARRDETQPLTIVSGLYWYWLMRGRLDEGERWTLAALDCGGGDPQARAWAMAVAGEYPRFRGEHDRAVELKEAALELVRSLDAPGMVAAMLYDLGDIALQQGQVDRARALFEDALARRRALGSELGVGHALTGLGDLANWVGNYPEAAEIFEELLSIGERHDDDATRAVGLVGRADAALGARDLDRARELLARALHLVSELNDLFMLPGVLVSVAAVLAEAERAEPAARLLAAAEAIRSVTGMAADNRARDERLSALVTESLGAERSAAARRAGGQMTAEEAIAYALERLAGVASDPARTGAGRA